MASQHALPVCHHHPGVENGHPGLGAPLAPAGQYVAHLVNGRARNCIPPIHAQSATQ